MLWELLQLLMFGLSLWIGYDCQKRINRIGNEVSTAVRWKLSEMVREYSLPDANEIANRAADITKPRLKAEITSELNDAVRPTLTDYNNRLKTLEEIFNAAEEQRG